MKTLNKVTVGPWPGSEAVSMRDKVASARSTCFQSTLTQARELVGDNVGAVLVLFDNDPELDSTCMSWAYCGSPEKIKEVLRAVSPDMRTRVNEVSHEDT